MAIAANGVPVPAGTSVFQPDVDMAALNAGLHGRISILAANATARGALATTCGWAPSATDPLVVLQTDTQTTWIYNGAIWSNTLATVAQVTATVGGIGAYTGVTLVTAPTVMGDGAKRVKISASLTGMVSTVAADTFSMVLWEDALQIRSGYAILNPGQTASNPVALSVSRVPTAGAHTYKLTAIRIGGTGTGSAIASATDPIEIIVEPIA